MSQQPTHHPSPPMGNLVETIARQIAASPGDPNSLRYRARWTALAAVMQDIEAERAGVTPAASRSP